MFEVLLDRLNKMEGVKAKLYTSEMDDKRYEVVVELVNENGESILDGDLPITEFFRIYNDFIRKFKKLVESDEDIQAEISLMEFFSNVE